MASRIRLFREDDADALVTLVTRSIKQIGPRKYSREQVTAWAARHEDASRFVERARQGQTILIAADEADRPIAYAILESDGHLDDLYSDPAHTRQGLAAALLCEAEATARRSGIELLYTEASELARASFERAGYRVTHRRDFEISHEGKDIPIHNYAMEKRLA
ncbi:GNAT family N-acetyltransferase [Citromicrobium bathyomarinum]|uniref:GNAT family N-acetyltransferase n=1 Tax=Citromicrobium bathyomarinum TaxID=72174 RepID=UPI003159FC10